MPLYRKTISGTAVEMRNEYGSRNGSATTFSGVDGDETEDLYTLLQTVKVRPLPGLDVRALNLPSLIIPISRGSLSVLFCLRTNASALSMCASTHSGIRWNLKIGQLPETGSHSSMLPLAM